MDHDSGAPAAVSITGSGGQRRAAAGGQPHAARLLATASRVGVIYSTMARKLVIMGAAGRDFHNFNVLFRDRTDVRVVAFTATQIPNIEGRRYPPALAGRHYPEGIPILAEAELPALVEREKVEEVVFSYSDVSHQHVMEKASEVVACGADFRLIGAGQSMLQAKVPVIAVCAVRTGCGKSQTTRRVAQILKDHGRRAVVVRHPMPYGDLERQRVQRFQSLEDMQKHGCTIEEMEEYEPHLEDGLHRLRRGGLRGHPGRGRRKRPRSSSGTAATTTSPSSSRTCGSPWWTPTARGTSCPTSRGASTCCGPTSS